MIQLRSLHFLLSQSLLMQGILTRQSIFEKIFQVFVTPQRLKPEEWLSVLPVKGARQAGITAIDSKNLVLAG